MPNRDGQNPKVQGPKGLNFLLVPCFGNGRIYIYIFLFFLRVVLLLFGVGETLALPTHPQFYFPSTRNQIMGQLSRKHAISILTF